MATFHTNILPDNGTYNSPDCYIVRKIISAEEEIYLAKCRKVMSMLVGDEFKVANPGWLRAEGLGLEIDGYSELFKIAIDYAPVLFYQLPEHLSYLYGDPETYAWMLEYIRQSRALAYIANGILTIPIFNILNDEEMEKYLRRELHELTFYRTFVGLPKSNLTLDTPLK